MRALPTVAAGLRSPVALLAAIVALWVPRAARAQGSAPAPAAVGVPSSGAPAPDGGASDASDGTRRFNGGAQFRGVQPPAGGFRQQLEQRVRMQFEQIVRRRLQLTDAQLARLRATNQEFAPQRRDLLLREQHIRQAMRAELQVGTVADEKRLATLIDSLFALQHQRLDMLQAEQRELATFLSPSQRVRYYALQEQLRRRIQAMRQARLGGQAAAP